MPSAWEWPTTDKKETGTIRFDDAGITITRNGQMRWLAGQDIGEVYRDRDDLVVVGLDGRELHRADVEMMPKDGVAEAFVARGWPWRASDAYMGHFTPWLDGRPELSAEAHALLRRRRQALAGKDSGLTDQLKDELADIGVVVRDRGQQEVRRLKSRCSLQIATAEPAKQAISRARWVMR